MGNRYRPYDPQDPYARPRRREDDGGWVVAGDEPDEWQRPPPARNGQPDPTPYYGQPAQPPRTYGPRAEPWADRYPPRPPARPAPGDPYGHDPPPPRYAGAGYPSRQPVRPPDRQPARLPPPGADEPDDMPPPALAPTVTWTIAAYLLPMLFYLAWAFTRSSTAPAGCVDASGAPCPPPRVEAAENLLGVLPAIVGALVLALLIAVGLRQLATGWRAASIGLAAAVVGGGIATVVAAALG